MVEGFALADDAISAKFKGLQHDMLHAVPKCERTLANNSGVERKPESCTKQSSRARVDETDLVDDSESPVKCQRTGEHQALTPVTAAGMLSRCSCAVWCWENDSELEPMSVAVHLTAGL